MIGLFSNSSWHTTTHRWAENFQIIKRVIPKSEDIKSLLSDKEWPNIVELNTTRKI